MRTGKVPGGGGAVVAVPEAESRAIDTSRTQPAAEQPLEAPGEAASTFGQKGAHSTTPQLEYRHDPLYDHLTADKQLTRKEVAAGYVAEWNGLNKVKVAE